jgi:hypothetical protein
MVVMAAVPTLDIGKEQDLAAVPSKWMVHAPHWAIPHPNLVPTKLK